MDKTIPVHFLVILSAIVVVAALAGFYLGQYMFRTVPHGFPITLGGEALLEELGWQGGTAQASFDPATGRMLLEVVLPREKSLPEGSFLEGWLRETHQTPPYELSTGKVTPLGRGGRYLNFFSTENTLSEYDEIAVTLEKDTNPRPGQVLFRGEIR